MKLLVDAIDPTRKQKLAAQKKAEQLLASLGIQPDVQLTEYEMSIASQLVDPATIGVKFTDIAGQAELVEELRQVVITPIQRRDMFAGSDLMTVPKGETGVTRLCAFCLQVSYCTARPAAGRQCWPRPPRPRQGRASSTWTSP